MGAQFGTNATNDVGWGLMDTEPVTITRTVLTAGVFPVAYTDIVIYSGAADFQDDPGVLAFNPAGPVDSAIGIVVIDPDENGDFPTILPNDILSAKGINYSVIESSIWLMAPTHLEVSVQRGPLKYDPAQG